MAGILGMLVVIHALDLSCIAGDGDRQLSGGIHGARKDFGDGRSAHLTGLPCVHDGIDRGTLDRPFHAQGAPAHQKQEGGTSRGRHGFQQFLLPARQVDVVPVAVLAAGAAEGGIALGVVAQNQNIELGLAGESRGPGQTGLVHARHASAEKERINTGRRESFPQSLVNGDHVFIGLGHHPVAQKGLAVGVRAAEEDVAIVFQRQDAVVFQQDNALAGCFQGRFAVPGIRGKASFGGKGRNGRFKKADGEFGRQDLPGRLVDAPDGDASALDTLQHRLEITVSLHVHVDARLHGNQESLFFAGHQVVHAVQALDVHPVAHYKAVETQFVAQDVLNQPRIGVAGNTVELIVGGHHRGHARFFHGHLERREVQLPHLAFAHVHGCGVEAAGRFTAADQMLGAGQHLALAQLTVSAL